MKKGNLRSVLAGFCEIADGLISVVSLGTLRYNFTFKFIAWAELRRLRQLHWETLDRNPTPEMKSISKKGTKP